LSIKNTLFQFNKTELKIKKMKKLFCTLLVIAFVWVNKNAIAQVRRTISQVRSNMISQQVQLQGSISIADNNILAQLQQGWNANISQAVGTQLKVELWQVNYVPDHKDNFYTNILLIQKLDANISYQLAQNSVQYNASYRPVGGNVVVIAYATYSVARGRENFRRPNSSWSANIKFSGKPNDGVPASMTHQFKSDVKKYLGNNIIYGIYSLPPRSGNFSNADFRVASSVKTCTNCDFISDGWNAVSDVANDVANAATDVANDIGNLVKTTADGTVAALNGALKDVGESIVANSATFMVQAFGVIATYVQSGDLPKARMLSDYGNAYNIANSTIFMQTLPPLNKIIVTNLMSINQRMFTLPIKIGNNVYILLNMGKAFDDPLNYMWNGYPGDVFIHELTHAWQIWHIDALKLVEDGAVNQFRNTVISDQYHYTCDGHNITDSYNEEQQAMIVENFYTLLFSRYSVLYDNTGKAKTCGFEQQWVVQNILNNQPSNIDGQFTATKQIILASIDRTLAGYTGGVIEHAIASPSNGNRLDGSGYFLPGKNNNSFFYYSNKTRATTANWGPVRDKFTKAGYEFGQLGWPETNETLLPDGVGYFQRFNHGFIYWHPKYGAYVILKTIFDAWMATGWEKGALGYPVSDYISNNPGGNKFSQSINKGGIQNFEHGFIELNVLEAMAGQTNITTSVHIYTMAEELAHRNSKPSMQTQKALENAPAGNSKFNNIKSDQVQPGRLRPSPGTQNSINPQPLPPKIIKGN
jgi:hypothetical protein